MQRRGLLKRRADPTGLCRLRTYSCITAKFTPSLTEWINVTRLMYWGMCVIGSRNVTVSSPFSKNKISPHEVTHLWSERLAQVQGISSDGIHLYLFSRLHILQGVPLATKPGISLIILTQMKILQRNLNKSTFVVWEMWRHHNMCWKWSPFASRQDWTRRSLFWEVLAYTSAVTAWISSVMFAFKASMFRGLFW